MLKRFLFRRPGWAAVFLAFGCMVLLAAASSSLAAADSVIISEFQASNSSGLVDEDGDHSDWIELFNTSSNTVSLDGWFLTDSANSLTKWRLPATNLAPNQFLIVFASGKDRAIPGNPLHASFSLRAEGEYLALVKSDGFTVASEYEPQFPPQWLDISYGLSQELRITRLISNTSPARIFIPANGTLGVTWTTTNFNDTVWRMGTNGVGFQSFQPGFSVRNIRANVGVCDLGTADAVLADPSKQAAVFRQNPATINYLNTGSGDHFGNDATFPGFTINVDENNFVTEVMGIITVPTSGAWTFGVNSDDGFRVELGAYTFSYPSPRGPADTLATFNLVAGDYPVRLVFYECGGGSELEFYAAAGTNAGWNAAFRLVGDPAGGLTVKSLPSGSADSASLRPLIASDVEKQMTNSLSSAYVRLPFQVASVADFSTLTLRMKYCDGFVAYLNGVEVARRNVPAGPQWNSRATTTRTVSEALIYETIDLTSRLDLLRNGSNVLSIHGLTSTTNASKFLALADLAEFKPLGLTNHYFATATPGDFNSAESYAFVRNLQFTPGRGWFDNTNFYVSISSGTPGAQIRYTTDGSAPSPTLGTLYAGPILVNRTTIVRAIGYLAGYEPTAVESHSYLFLDQVQAQSTNVNDVGGSAGNYSLNTNITLNPPYRDTFKQDLLSVPTLSLAVAWEDFFGPNGIWSNTTGQGAAWERACSAEYLRPDGEKGFNINCGLRIQGGVSRTGIPKHSLRLLFKAAYGPTKLDYDLYPDSPVKEFDTLTLHAGFNDHWGWGGTAATEMRDQWCRDAQRAMGGYGTHGTYAHLYINGIYWGLYNIGEHGDASYAAHYMGGDKDDYDAVNSDQIVDGDGVAWSTMVNMANAGLATDSAYQAFAQYLDIPDFIDYMLMNFYAANTDWPWHNWKGARRRAPGAGFHFFSWDAEWTFGIGSDVNTDRTGETGGSAGLFYSKLRAHPEFVREFGDRAQKHLFNGGALTPAAAEARWQARVAEIDRAIIPESARWGGGNTRDTWLGAVSGVRAWFPQRADILLNQLRSAGLYPQVSAPEFSPFGGLVTPGYALTLTHANPGGTIYYTVDGADPRQWGGSLNSSARPYTTAIVLTNATYLRARVLSGANWSALVEAVFYVVQDFSHLTLAELMYAPPYFGATSGEELEFVELKNTGTNTIDLTGLQFTDGINFVFTNGTRLAPGQFLVLARNAAAFSTRHPGVAVHGIYQGKLDNSGEKLTLAHVLGTNVFSFTFQTSLPWPITPAGLGFSLVRLPGANDPSLASSWRASALPGGSPGAEDPPVSAPPILINEILTHTDPPQPDAIELFNPTDQTVNIGGWFLSDEAAVPMKYRIPDDTMIIPGGYAVFDENHFNPYPDLPPGFALNSQGESLYLFSGDATTNLTGYSHGIEFGSAPLGVSLGRFVISTGEEQWPAQTALTLGGENSGPRVGPLVINEIMYHPADGYDEFLEIHNLSSNAVPLYDPAYPSNTWRLNGLGYSFPGNLTLAPGGFLLLAPIEPEVFRAKYLISAEVPIIGPYLGALQDSGERLRLEQPDVPGTNGPNFVTVDEVRFNDKFPWSVGADGEGPSLQRRLPQLYGNEPTNWFASGVTPGAPNAFNQPPTCALISPNQGAVFAAPASIELIAEVADADGAITRVEFFAGNIKLGEVISAPYVLSWQSVPAGNYVIVAKAWDNGLAVASAAPINLIVNPPPAGNGIGLKAEYYDNQDFTGATVTRTNATVDFDWGSGAPDPAIGADSFSVRWTGLVQPRYSETYTFYTVSDDGVRLWVNNQLLINNWGDHGPTEDSGVIVLQGGALYQVTMEMYENGGGAVARLLWSSPSVTKEVIPASQLYPVRLALPVITTPPTSQTVGLGATATFNVTATGASSYQWLFHNLPIANARKSNLTISNAQYTNEGPYRVVLANATGAITSAPVYLSVVAPPEIVGPPQSKSVAVGASAKFTVAVQGGLPLQFQWRWNGLDLPGATNATLIVTNVQIANLGSYSVRVSNPGGSVTSPAAVLSLNLPCAILEQPVSLTWGPLTNTITTNVAVLSVTAVGMGPLSYQWAFWNTNLPGATNAFLVISNVALTDAGPYAVQVSDGFDTVTSSNATIKLLVKPFISEPLVDQAVVYNGTVTLVFHGGPIHPTLPLTNIWVKNGAFYLTNQENILIETSLTASNYFQVALMNEAGVFVSPRANIAVLADKDRDGVPDDLERVMGYPVNYAPDGAWDYDGDGMNNAAEVAAGTDPTNPMSVLKLDMSEPATNGHLRLSFMAVPQKTYQVEYREDLWSGPWSNLTRVWPAATNRTIWFTDPLPILLTNRYYRIRTPWSP